MENCSKYVSDKTGTVLFLRKNGRFSCTESWEGAYRLIFQTKATVEYIDLDNDFTTNAVEAKADVANHTMTLRVPAAYGDSSKVLEITYSIADGISAEEVESSSGLPTGGAPHQQLVTDADGMVVWEKKKLSDKKWACVGDSLTAVNDRTDMHYHDYIAERTGITVVNMGSGGTGYKAREEEERAFYQRVSAVPSDADVVTIFGSGNDMGLMDASDATWEALTPTWNTSQYLRGDGSGNIADYSGHDTWVVSDLISVNAGDIYRLTAGIQYKKSVLVFYDSNEAYISQLASETDEAYVFTDEIVTTPENAAYMRVGNVTTIATFSLEKQTSGSGGLGNPTDTGTNTICGCINTTIDNLYSVLPIVQLGIITPTPWSGYPPSVVDNKMALYSAALVEICRLRGIPCLDLYHCSGLRPWEESYHELAYSKDEGKGVHPDEVGHALIAPKIKAFIDSMFI